VAAPVSVKGLGRRGGAGRWSVGGRGGRRRGSRLVVVVVKVVELVRVVVVMVGVVHPHRRVLGRRRRRHSSRALAHVPATQKRTKVNFQF